MTDKAVEIGGWLAQARGQIPLPFSVTQQSSNETVRNAAIDAIVETIWRETDPWRRARLLAFVRKERQHAGLRELAGLLYEEEKDVPVPERRCYWAALELLTEPSAMPPETGPLWIEPVSGVCLVRIGPGKFRMGSESEEADVDEEPVHEVEITRDYWLGRHAVTNGEYRRYLEGNREAREPEEWANPRFRWAGQPVVGVSWWETEEGYCEWLREETGLAFHLPTEAEWEYACRAGSDTEYCFGDGAEDLANYAWYSKGWEEGSTHVVGSKRANAWGLQDMHGNVWEWCWDWYGDYPREPQRDPTVLASGSYRRVLRGGSWDLSAGGCRSAFRRGRQPGPRDDSLGFRLALSPVRRPEAG